jgi:DNA-binding PadR family transcriptional regulator
VKTWLARRRQRYEAAVLGCLLQGDIYAIDMWTRIGGSGGAIYVALASLEAQGMVCSDWADGPKPRRRRYWLREVDG